MTASRYLPMRRLGELLALDHPWLAPLLRRGRVKDRRAPADAWDRMYETGAYDKLLISSHRHHHRLLASLLAERIPNPRILEVGCGDGAFYESARLFRPARYLGVDISESAISRCRSRRGDDAAAPGVVAFRVADGQRFSPGEMFDAIVFADSLEYLGPPADLLAHYEQFLDPQGFFGATQWLALGPLRLWGDVKSAIAIEDEALVEAPWGGAWQIWTGRPRKAV